MTRSFSLDFRYFKVECLCLFLAVAGGGFAETPTKPASAPERTAKAKLLNLPLSFEANRGQTDPSVKFLSRGDGYALFLTEDSAVFKLSAARDKSPAVVRMKLAGASLGAKVAGGETLPGTVNYFIGNDPQQWTRGAATFGKVDYRQIYRGIDLVYYGTQRQLEYDFVVAPGADPKQIALEFSGTKPKLTADGDLALTLDGAPLSFRKPVVYQMNGGKKEMVAGSYTLSGDRVHFALGRYDRSRALVIDPVLNYLTYLGGTGDDFIANAYQQYSFGSTQGIAVDPAGNVYVTGLTQSINFPVLNAIQAVSNDSTSYTGFVTKLNAAGSQLIYSTYIGGGVRLDNSTTQPHAIAVDGSGNAYVTGSTSSPNFPTTPGAYQTFCGFLSNNVSACPNVQSAFLTKLSPSGNSLVYSTLLGPVNEAALAVAVDSQGKAYIAGISGDQCGSSDPIQCFPTTANAVLAGSAFNHTTSPTNFNQGSVFVAVFDAAGAHLLYSSLYGGKGSTATGNDGKPGNNGPTNAPVGVAVDAAGNFYLAGATQSNQLPVTAGAFQTTYYGPPNAGTEARGFVAKFSPVTGVGTGATLVYSTYLGGMDSTHNLEAEQVAGIAADASGNAYIAGNTGSYDFPVTIATPSYCSATLGCQNTGFLTKLNPTGSAVVWSTLVGATTNCCGGDVAGMSPPRLDLQGNVYVSGYLTGPLNGFPLVNPIQPFANVSGVFVTEYDPTGSTVYFSTELYSPSNNRVVPGGIDIDPQGNIYVAGTTLATDLPATAGSFQPALPGTPGHYHGFIAKISAPVIPPTPTITLVANAEGEAPRIAPNTWVEIKGSDLSPAGDSRTWASSDFVNGKMPTNLDGVSVTVNGKPAYVYYISPTQVNILTPPDAISGSVPIRVTDDVAVSAPFLVQAQADAPSFFVFGAGPYVAATHANGSLIGPTTLYPGASTPAQPGETIVVYANGFGPTSTSVVSGSVSQSGTLSPLPVIAIGGVAATVKFAGLNVTPGEFQFNVVVPPSLANGDQTISATYNGLTTQSGTLITVHN